MSFWHIFVGLFVLIALGAAVLSWTGEPQAEDWRNIRRRLRTRYRWLRRICGSRQRAQST